ncbi:MAG: radical SAM protein [Methylococcaceae bacterium]|nr:radical SAM protein [Methylococcaceae bacterium]
MKSKLSTTNHCSDIVGLKYVYPVISRRTGGMSVGINFNTNNGCNWRCIYCQVPNLKFGAAPDIDFRLLEKELRFFLDHIVIGNFYDRFEIEEKQRVIKDIAIAGNGEPTSLREFAGAVQMIGNIANEFGVFPKSDFVLITNGSLLNKTRVQEGLRRLNQFGGEVWFKLDSATGDGRRLINNTGQSIDSAIRNMKLSAQLCQTKLQICLFSYDNQGLTFHERIALIAVLKTLISTTDIKCILLYSIARPSMQPESVKLESLPLDTINEFAEEIRALGFDVSVSV